MEIARVVTSGIVLGILAWMAWEDTRYRAVSVWTFPLLFVLLLTSRAYASSWAMVLWSVQINFMIVVVQLSAIWLYLIIKHQSMVNPMQGYIGWGDVLFWIAILPAFSPMAFMLFYVVSLSAALLMHGIFRSSRLYGDASKIPLAGLQAVVYSAWLLIYGLTETPAWLAKL